MKRNFFQALAEWVTKINTEEDQTKQRGQLLAFFLGLTLFAIFILTLINLIKWGDYKSTASTRFVLFDLLTLFGFTILWFLNRNGWVSLSAHLTLTLITISTNFVFEPQDLIHGFALLTIPVIMSSFILAAGWAFFYTTLGAGVYTLIYWVSTPTLEYEYLVVLSLYIFAGVSYLIASRYNALMRGVRASEEKFRTLFDRIPVGLYRTAPDGQILDANPALLKMFGATNLEAFKKTNAAELYVNENDHAKWLDDFSKGAIADEFVTETQFKRADGTTFWATDATRAIYDENGQLIFFEGSLADVSKRRQVEEALLKSEERFRNIFESATVGIYRTTPAGDILLANQTLLQMLRYDSLDELMSRNLATDGFEPEYPRSEFQKKVEADNEIRGLEAAWKRRDGSTIYVRESAKVVRDQSGNILYYEGSVEDITDRKLAENKIKEQVDQLSALRKIDITINSSTDLRLSLNAILNEAVRVTGVDAADVLLLEPNLHLLQYAAGLGFTDPIKSRNIRLGEGLTGKSALDNRKVEIHNLDEQKSQTLLPGNREKFTCYRCYPLAVKGKITGVLETYSRNHHEHTPGWYEFLDALAGQAAIAIENASLFKELQLTNLDLTIAYDQAIEGWAQALDLREKGSENHARNVTDISLRLGSAMGFKDKDLLHLRYGALLHDIGKMGVSDQVLRKPGKLTEEEWEEVHQHPIYAYNLLKRIPYLRPVLDIPYSHHERWDGSGYPQGLSGEDIPLAARIFAIADVYDALTSDRPYRKKWPREQALKYIAEKAGTEFDPEVVEAFLKEFG